MDYDKLIERLREHDGVWCSVPTGKNLITDAATALSTLQAENKRLNKIVCSIPTTPDSGRTVSQYDKEMSMCAYLDDLEAENEKLRAELESVRAERNAAVEDVAAIIGDVEEIRRGYGVDNADADGAFARLCETYCANNGCLCYAECEKYHCKNFKWRGI